MAGQESQRHRLIAPAAGIVVLLFPLAYFAALVPYGLNIDDEGTILYQIFRTAIGQRLYVDFHAGYTPGVFLWHAALFQLFGVNILVLRGCLALVNGVSAYCLYWLARRLGVSTGAAVTAGLLYVAFIPFYDGQFASFNIPYPTWYATLFWLLAVMCVIRWWSSGRAWLWLLAGVCSGVVFSFKPNTGLLNLAALLMALVFLQRPPAVAAGGGPVRRSLLRLESAFRWLIPVVLALGLTAQFGGGPGSGTREVGIFVLPLLVVIAYSLRSRDGQALARAVEPFTVWRALLLLAAGFAAVVVPWVAYYLAELGLVRFLRVILFVGSNFEQFYFLPYPWIGVWEMAMAVGAVAIWAAGVMLRRGWLPRWPILAGALLVVPAGMAWLATHPPPMVEGFQASVVMRFRFLAFGLILLAEWAAIVTYVSRAAEAQTGVGAVEAGRRRPVLLILLLSAVLMHMCLYPRTDFMHLVPAAPGVLILGAWLLDGLARLWARGLAQTRAGRLVVRAAVLAPVYVLAVILLAPALARIEYLARAWAEGDESAVVRLDSPRAPLVIEPAAGRPFLSLSQTARYLREHSEPGDFVFTFPAIDMVNFVADRVNPTRHGYFYPGWPGHEVEAEVIDALDARPPRYIVSLHDHALYFIAAPVYYYNLRQYVTERFRLARRIGMFDILAPVGAGAGAPAAPGAEKSALGTTIDLWRQELRHRRGAEARRIGALLAGLPAAEPDALAGAIGGLDAAGRRAIARLIRKSRSAEGAAALAIVLERHPVHPAVHELFIRIIAEMGDSRAAPPLLRALVYADPARRASLAGDLFTIAARSWVEEYWYAPPERDLGKIAQAVPLRQVVRWMDDPWELFALRSFGLRIAGSIESRDVVPFLVRVVGDATEFPQLRLDAAQSLVELGFGPEVFQAIAGLLEEDGLLPAVLSVKVYRQAPEAGGRLVGAYLQSPDDEVRSRAFWIAAAVRDPALTSAVQVGLGDPVPEVRMAAAWTLGAMGVTDSLDALQQMAHNDDDQVAAYAERAIEAIRGDE